ncbi:F-box/FBD/LRR-repeat protein-like protein [Tanacetum coccineum]|uniref:F-box/FBD/LRR-repeat protein-like protein n=1 Tax=Tanacetum coccineum TaxID=301880 RepID=A0ABQ4XEQ9_9ASTR
MDRISNLPLSLLETILCLLPYHEVVRTSTLSKEWRYHWTNVTKIVVIEDTRTLNRIKLLSGVSQALLMHKGPIHELTLSIAKDDHWGFDTAIRRIISHLSSKKAVKKLTVDFVASEPKVRLKRKKEEVGCVEDKQRMDAVKEKAIEAKNAFIARETRGYKVKNAMGISQVKEYTSRYRWKPTTNREGKSLPLDNLPKEVPIALVHLKHLCIEDIYFGHYYALRIISLFIKSSSNLEKLTVKIKDDERRGEIMDFSYTIEEYTGIWMEHLSELEITYISSEQTEMDIVNLILMRSPVLKKSRIFISKNIYYSTCESIKQEA